MPFSFATDPAMQMYVWEACVKAQMVTFHYSIFLPSFNTFYSRVMK